MSKRKYKQKRLKLYAEENIEPDAVRYLINWTKVVSALERGWVRKEDRWHLAKADSLGLTFVTRNGHDVLGRNVRLMQKSPSIIAISYTNTENYWATLRRIAEDLIPYGDELARGEIRLSATDATIKKVEGGDIVSEHMSLSKSQHIYVPSWPPKVK